MVVPAQGRDAIAFAHAQVLQALGQAACARIELAVAVLDQGFIGQARDNFVAWKQSARPLQKMVQGQRHLHHGAGHVSVCGHLSQSRSGVEAE